MFRDRKNRRVIVVLSAFGDDSADRNGSVFCVAAVVGSESDWDALETLWRGRLGCRVFHATDCDADRKVFKHFTHDENQRLYSDLTRILAQSKLMGYAHVLDLGAFRRVFSDGMPPWDAQFYFGISRTITDCARLGYLSLPQEPVKFTFDERKESKYNTAELYRYAAKLNDWTLSDFLADEVAFAVRSNVGIQVADLWAREAMKEAERQIRQGRDIRPTWRQLDAEKRFRANIYSDEYVQQMREGVAAMDAPHSQAEYQAWLKRKRLKTDNVSNRIKWLAWTDVRNGLMRRDG